MRDCLGEGSEDGGFDRGDWPLGDIARGERNGLGDRNACRDGEWGGELVPRGKLTRSSSVWEGGDEVEGN